MKFKERNYTEISEADQRPLDRGGRSEVARLGRGGQPAWGSDREASDAPGHPPELRRSGSQGSAPAPYCSACLLWGARVLVAVASLWGTDPFTEPK